MVATAAAAILWSVLAYVATGSAVAFHLFQNDIAPTSSTFQDPLPQEKPKPKPIKVVGTVKDGEGRPVAKAQVKITGPNEFAHETWTNEGAFEFTAPDGTGPYRITVKVDDKENTFEASIRQGRLSPGDFTLR